MKKSFLVIDFGSQYTQLIARRLRELDVYSEILPYDISIEELRSKDPAGLILSGGPSSVKSEGAPHRDVKELLEIAPVLGVCYGMQLLCEQLGGSVVPAQHREYGLVELEWEKPFPGLPTKQKVWMSHGDVVEKLPPGFELLASSPAGHPAALRGPGCLGIQFHPEVAHTEQGLQLLEHFVRKECSGAAVWTSPQIVDHLLSEIKALVPEGDHVLCALSGGVDSTVVATLLTKALGADRVHGVFINNGLLRKNEFEEVLKIYETLQLNVEGVDCEEIFLSRLKGVVDPEEKRKIIGHTFIDVFKSHLPKIPATDWLAQGTLYPDVIESVSLRGTSVTIKSHHNVGGLPKDLNLKLVEPLRELFKDEVRRIGKELGIPPEFLWRHPFPGPGLSIRVIGEITKPALETLRDADWIYTQALREKGLYDQIWQAFAVLLPIHTVGVQGDSRSYDQVLGLRAVTSSDGMTADWFDFPADFLRDVSNRITNQVQGVNRVVYDVTSKPPGTIEWE